MKLGVGLYRYMLKDEEFTFARQCGCSDVIIHLANYTMEKNDIVKATDEGKITESPEQGVCLESGPHDVAPEAWAKGKGLNIYGIEEFQSGGLVMIYCWMDLKGRNRWSIWKEIIRNCGKSRYTMFRI